MSWMEGLDLPPVVQVTGFADGPFSELTDIFARCIARQGTGGAALAVYAQGRSVVDLVGGDFATDTLARVFSVTKAIAALAVAHASASGRLDLDQPLGDYWDAFARRATATITARMILAHTSGIPAVASPLTLEQLLAGELDIEVSRQDPYWKPGSKLGYGAFTYGALLNGVFLRALDISISGYVAENLTGPANADFWFGAPSAELSRVAPLHFRPHATTPAEAGAHRAGAALRDGSLAALQASPPAFLQDPRVVQADWPSMSGVGTARSIARLFAAAVGPVDGIQLLNSTAVALLTSEQSSGPDDMLFHGTRFGLGVELPHPHFPLLGAGSFGHEGAGGSAIAVDPARQVSVAFTTNAWPATPGASDAGLVLIGAVRHCLAAQ